MNAFSHISIERWTLSALLSLFIAILAAVACTALVSSATICLTISVVVLVLCTALIAARLPENFDGIFSKKRLLSIIWLILALTAIIRIGGVALYMADSEQPQASAIWFEDFYVNHNCLSAYWKAGEIALGMDNNSAGQTAAQNQANSQDAETHSQLTNIYSAQHYAGHVGRFKIDEYLYPPQFLLLPQTATALGADFLQMRALWFAVDSALIAAAMLALCFWLGGKQGRRIALLLPAIWLATPTLITLQTGNFQLAAIALAVFAMVLFEQRRLISGGALLGFAMFKIFPGVLCAYLLFAKRWKELFSIVSWMLIFSLIALLVMGTQPFHDFLFYELPRIASGEVWAWLNIDGLQGVIAINHSVPGLVLKLDLMGVPGMDMSLMSGVAWFWSLLVIGLAFLAAQRSQTLTSGQQAQLWLVLLSLAALRSPFVPDDYALFPTLWLLVLVAGSISMTLARAALFVVLWLLISIVIPAPIAEMKDVPMMLFVGTLSQLSAIAFCFWTFYRHYVGSPSQNNEKQPSSTVEQEAMAETQVVAS